MTKLTLQQEYAQLLTEEDYYQAERSLFHFFKATWGILEPARDLKLKWYQQCVCEYLELVSSGEIKRLLINMPPRHLKSTLVTVCFPCWEWITTPTLRYLTLSYGAKLSTDHSKARRLLIQSDWYQQGYRDRFSIAPDHNLKTEFENNHRGIMHSASIGSVLGFGGDRLICVPYDTEITTDIGSIKIGRIVTQRLACKIATFNHATQKIEYQLTDQVFESTSNKLVMIAVDSQKLLCTENHPVWIYGKGYVPACLVKPQDPVIAYDSQDDNCWRIRIVKAVKIADRPDNLEHHHLYNIATANHNYFANGILVHNCDDPHDPEGAESDLQRATKLSQFDDATGTRLNDPKESVIIVVMQRLHHLDVSGHILADIGGYTHLCLPTEAEETTTIVFPKSDRHYTREVGTLLHPERMDWTEIEQAKKTLGEYKYAGRHQQRPSPASGGLIKRIWWRYWDYLPRGNFDNMCISVDAAFKGNANSDYVVIQAWKKKGHMYYLLDQIRERMTFTETEVRIVNMKHKYPEIHACVIEDKANGPAIIDRLSRREPGIIAWNPGKDSKISRVTAIAPLIEAQTILLPPNMPWVDALINEFTQFPNGANDDQIDCLSQAISYMESRSPDTSWLHNL